MTPLSRIRRRRTEETPADPFPVPEDPSAQEAQQLTAEAVKSIPPPTTSRTSSSTTTSIDPAKIAEAAAAVEATAVVPAQEVPAQEVPGTLGTPDTQTVPGTLGTPDTRSVPGTLGIPEAEEVPGTLGTPEAEAAPSGLRRFGLWATGRSTTPAEQAPVEETPVEETPAADAVEGEVAAAAPEEAQPQEPAPEVAGVPATKPRGPSARDRGRLRRRIRYLRRARELGLRDLGGLMFDQYRFRTPNQELLAAKLAALHALDSERRALEHILGDRRDFDDLREPGIAACPQCGALRSSDAKFCEVCGTRQSEIPPPPAPAADA